MHPRYIKKVNNFYYVLTDDELCKTNYNQSLCPDCLTRLKSVMVDTTGQCQFSYLSYNENSRKLIVSVACMDGKSDRIETFDLDLKRMQSINLRDIIPVYIERQFTILQAYGHQLFDDRLYIGDNNGMIYVFHTTYGYLGLFNKTCAGIVHSIYICSHHTYLAASCNDANEGISVVKITDRNKKFTLYRSSGTHYGLKYFLIHDSKIITAESSYIGVHERIKR